MRLKYCITLILTVHDADIHTVEVDIEDLLMFCSDFHADTKFEVYMLHSIRPGNY